MAQTPPPQVAPKRLMRSWTNSKIAGVCGGFAEYLDIDPTVVRLIWLLLIFTPAPAVLGYLIAWIVIPVAPQPAAVSPAPQPGVHSPQTATQN